MILTIDEDVNKDLNSILEGHTNSIIMGKMGLEPNNDYSLSVT